MKALRQRKYGSPDYLEIGEIGEPNRFLAGVFKPGIIVGSDIAGRVESVGRNVSRLKPMELRQNRVLDTPVRCPLSRRTQ